MPYIIIIIIMPKEFCCQWPVLDWFIMEREMFRCTGRPGPLQVQEDWRLLHLEMTPVHPDSAGT